MCAGNNNAKNKIKTVNLIMVVFLVCRNQKNKMERDKNQEPATIATENDIAYGRVARMRETLSVNLLARAVEPAVGMAVKVLTIVAEAPEAEDASTARIGRVTSLGSTCMDMTLALSVDATDENVKQYALGARLRRAEEAIEAAETLFRLATARVQSSSMPASLVAALERKCGVFPLYNALVDAVTVGGDANTINRCLGIALRVEALGRSYTQLRKKVRARPALGPVSAWLLRIANGSAYVATPIDVAALAVVHVAESDQWMPVINIARAAGQTCSAPLLKRACTEIRRRADQHTHVLANGGAKSWWLCHTTRRPTRDYAAIATIALGAFAKGLTKPVDNAPSHDCMAMCRGPALALAREVQMAIDVACVHEWTVPLIDPINQARAMLAPAIGTHTGDRRDALVYMLGLLTSVAVVCADRARIGDDVPLQQIASYLGDPTNPLHALALKGLNISGYDNAAAVAKPETIPGPVDPRPPCNQDDLLSALCGHHPDLFMSVLTLVDQWDIGSIALASRTHYAHVVTALREDDAAGVSRRLTGVALSGTFWFQQRVDSLVYDPVARLITPPSPPPPAQESLPDLRVLLFLCRSMASRKHVGPCEMWSAGESAWYEAMAVACVLGCGDAIMCCIGWTGLVRRTDVWWNQDLHRRRIERLAEKAGFYGSPLMLHIAVTESLSAMARTEHGPDYARARPICHIRSLVDRIICGIVEGLREPESEAYFRCRTGYSPRHRRRLEGLPALVDILCAFLKGVRSDMDSGRTDIVDATYACVGFRRAAMAVLAPGICLPMPQLRTRLGLALFAAAKPVWTQECAVDLPRSTE
ncbi:hypothetical protein TW95_gp0925 [Pandoravirus inopinatum]|uniref:DUF5867 domain-containing protein n=1 Tax=Pandoravirus inopinatum TaxID=1605721 RepID=A0A0B5J2A9_9VIRU|nr:hypothetical protein TW95_gp0925 [Pandoravirus inopinatum]AJF97659.1 hypothetical protein [Pandoravirus inopinatum]